MRGGQLEPAGQSRSNERLLQIGCGPESPCTAVQLSGSLHACAHTLLLRLNSLFLALLPFLPPLISTLPIHSSIFVSACKVRMYLLREPVRISRALDRNVVKGSITNKHLHVVQRPSSLTEGQEFQTDVFTHSLAQQRVQPCVWTWEAEVRVHAGFFRD